MADSTHEEGQEVMKHNDVDVGTEVEGGIDTLADDDTVPNIESEELILAASLNVNENVNLDTATLKIEQLSSENEEKMTEMFSRPSSAKESTVPGDGMIEVLQEEITVGVVAKLSTISPVMTNDSDELQSPLIALVKESSSNTDNNLKNDNDGVRITGNDMPPVEEENSFYAPSIVMLENNPLVQALINTSPVEENTLPIIKEFNWDCCKQSLDVAIQVLCRLFLTQCVFMLRVI